MKEKDRDKENKHEENKNLKDEDVTGEDVEHEDVKDKDGNDKDGRTRLGLGTRRTRKRRMKTGNTNYVNAGTPDLSAFCLSSTGKKTK